KATPKKKPPSSSSLDRGLSLPITTGSFGSEREGIRDAHDAAGRLGEAKAVERLHDAGADVRVVEIAAARVLRGRHAAVATDDEGDGDASFEARVSAQAVFVAAHE